MRKDVPVLVSILPQSQAIAAILFALAHIISLLPPTFNLNGLHFLYWEPMKKGEYNSSLWAPDSCSLCKSSFMTD